MSILARPPVPVEVTSTFPVFATREGLLEIPVTYRPSSTSPWITNPLKPDCTCTFRFDINVVCAELRETKKDFTLLRINLPKFETGFGQLVDKSLTLTATQLATKAHEVLKGYPTAYLPKLALYVDEKVSNSFKTIECFQEILNPLTNQVTLECIGTHEVQDPPNYSLRLHHEFTDVEFMSTTERVLRVVGHALDPQIPSTPQVEVHGFDPSAQFEPASHFGPGAELVPRS